jgi:hypothetical protein
MSEEEKKKYYINVQSIEIEKLILAIRKELGYKNRKVQEYDILRMYINDVDNYIDRDYRQIIMKK